MGQGASLKDQIKAERNDIRRKERMIEREILMMQNGQEKIVRQLKKEIKNGNMINARYVAKNYSMMKSNIEKLYKMKNSISTLSLQMQMMGSQNEIHEAMARVTATMKLLNRHMNLPTIKQIIKEFETEKLRNEVTTDMMDTMMDGDEQDEETEEEILGKVCDELQIKMSQTVREPPSEPIYFSSSRNNDMEISNLEKRLADITNNNF